jgi:D-serine deaminase-like pyridoxal phosphate-dependent protein
MNLKISKPSLIVDENKCKQKIEAMASKAKKHQLQFRPHFKTHQSIEIGRWFREIGIDKITVSSIEMAQYFASDAWDDITVAFPMNWLEIDKINALSKNIKLNLVVVSLETVRFLNQKMNQDVGIFIKVDTGYHRTGVNPEDEKLIEAIIQEIEGSEHLNLLGFLSHNGHTYKTKSVKEIEEIHLSSLRTLSNLKSKFENKEHPIMISIGDTPSISLMNNFEGMDEIRPGNFIFYDLVQEQLGACKFSAISVVMACPVVAKHPERNTIIIYGGGVHHSKESLKTPNGEIIFGRIVRFEELGWSEPISDCKLISVSQEHGVIHAPKEFIDSLNIGDVLGVLPVHSCMTADLQDSYIGLKSGRFSNYRNIH